MQKKTTEKTNTKRGRWERKRETEGWRRHQ